MAQTSMQFHSCSNLVVSQHMPENSNALSLIIRRADFMAEVELTFFNMPTDLTDALIAALEHTPQFAARRAEEVPIPREEWPSVMDAAETPFAGNH